MNIDEQSRIIEETNPTLRLQKQNCQWRRLQEQGLCDNEHTKSYSKYIDKHLQQASELLVYWSQQPPTNTYDPALLPVAHREMFRNLHPWAGDTRKQEVVFGRFTATSHVHLKMGMEVMRELVAAMPAQTTYQTFLKIAVYHIFAVGLHPFIDGNGRATRTVMAHQIAQAGFNPVPLIQYMEANRREYIHANNMGLEANDPKPLAKLMAGVYNVPTEETQPDFRMRYLPAHYQPTPINLENIFHECQTQITTNEHPIHHHAGRCRPHSIG